MDAGLPKLWLIRQVLHWRRDHPECFGPEAGYRPLAAEGAKAAHAVAYVRGEAAVAVAPRRVLQLDGDWADTTLELPAGGWHNRLNGEAVAGGPVRLRDLLARFPVALLVREE
jgi:(1->4)-alpha-D-glucan 1-alpha-D-glucosylmutase